MTNLLDGSNYYLETFKARKKPQYETRPQGPGTFVGISQDFDIWLSSPPDRVIFVCGAAIEVYPNEANPNWGKLLIAYLKERYGPHRFPFKRFLL